MNQVGLTGGIATGKSTVARMLQQLGAYVIDADQIAREVVRKGSAAWQEIAEAFGRGILQADQEIDRVRLGEMVFTDPEKKRLLEDIVHPQVFKEMADRSRHVADTREGTLVVMDIPLLFETRDRHSIAPVILVWIPEELQLTRLMARDHSSREAALGRIRAQMPIAEKRQWADWVIDNSGSLDATWHQVRELFAEIRSSH